MTASSARSRLVLLQAAARPTAASSSSSGPHAAKVRRYRLARAHLQAQRTQQLATATEVMRGRRVGV